MSTAGTRAASAAASGSGAGTGVALGIITVGGIMVYSAFKGIGITDVLAGTKGDTLDPHGSSGGAGTGSGSDALIPGDPTAQGVATGGDWTAPAGGAHGFKGPNADTLNTLAGIAQHAFGLTITATTNGGHVPGSYHYQDRAFDAAGGDTGMRGFAQYVQDHYGNTVLELIHNPGFAIKNGQTVNGPVVYAAVWAGHKDHVHVAM